MKALSSKYQGELVLVCLLAIYAVAGFIVQGCGGGGGGGQPQSQLFSSQQVVKNVILFFGKVHRFIAFSKVAERGFHSQWQHFSRQDTCPEVGFVYILESAVYASNPPDYIEVDYGKGCVDKKGDFIRGSFTILLVSPQVDAKGYLIGGTVAYGFKNFSINGETIDGTAEENINGLTSNVSLDLEYQTGKCWEHLTFDGTITYFADRTSFTVSGKGTFSSVTFRRLVQVNYVVTNLRFVETCDFPVGGTLKATYNGTTEEWSFSETCGVGVVSVNGGQPQQVALKDIPPCD
jgi:hypothetical protein